jgi:hypothetical protein
MINDQAQVQDFRKAAMKKNKQKKPTHEPIRWDLKRMEAEDRVYATIGSHAEDLLDALEAAMEENRAWRLLHERGNTPDCQPEVIRMMAARVRTDAALAKLEAANEPTG